MSWVDELLEDMANRLAVRAERVARLKAAGLCLILEDFLPAKDQRPKAGDVLFIDELTGRNLFVPEGAD